MTKTAVNSPTTKKARAQASREELLSVIEQLNAKVDELQERNTELERLRATDPLTGTWNRWQFDRAVALELDRSVRYKQPLSLLLIDIDLFKKVNDTLGHKAGDAVLKELASIITAGVRIIDGVYRWGGEEFAVLVTSTSYHKAGILAEKLRKQIAQTDFAGAGPVTVSIGVAEHRCGESASEWFERVDAALYRAKIEGRNRVHVDLRGDSDLWEGIGSAPIIRLVWREAYACGQPQIDDEHRRLFELANEAFDASFFPNGEPWQLAPALDRLLAHIAQHFEHEEKILAASGYARLETHRRAHAALIGRARELKASVDRGQASTGDLVEFLASKVVAQHLLMADADFFPLFLDDKEQSAA